MKIAEKRQSPRIGLRSPLRYQIRGTHEYDNAVLENISEKGLSFISNNQIPSSATMMLEVNILSRTLRPIGRITWSSPVPHSERNRFGIEFLEFNNIDKNYLSDYIKLELGQL